jgi:hypothetical protein
VCPNQSFEAKRKQRIYKTNITFPCLNSQRILVIQLNENATVNKTASAAMESQAENVIAAEGRRAKNEEVLVGLMQQALG